MDIAAPLAAVSAHRDGVVYAVAVLDADNHVVEVVVAFPNPGTADEYARVRDFAGYRVVPIRFHTARPRED